MGLILKRNFCFNVNVTFGTTWMVTLYILANSIWESYQFAYLIWNICPSRGRQMEEHTKSSQQNACGVPTWPPSEYISFRCWLWLFLVVTKPLHRTFSGWQRAQNFAYHCQTLNLKERFIVTKSSSFLPSPLENKRSELHLANWLLQTSCQQRRPRKSSWIFNTRSFTLLYFSNPS